MTEAHDRWIEFARLDVRAAEVMLKADLTAQACFHAHQAVEKILKALIQKNTGQPAPRIHGLQELLKHLTPDQQDRMAQAVLMELDDYYIPTRYPDAIPGSLSEGLPSRSQAEEAVSSSRAVLKIAVEVLS